MLRASRGFMAARHPSWLSAWGWPGIKMNPQFLQEAEKRVCHIKADVDICRKI